MDKQSPKEVIGAGRSVTLVRWLGIAPSLKYSHVTNVGHVGSWPQIPDKLDTSYTATQHENGVDNSHPFKSFSPHRNAA